MQHQFSFRIRYAETDMMGRFYHSRALEWFEMGRSELARAMGVPYLEWEQRGIYLPLVEAYVKYQGPATYDDLLTMTVGCEVMGLARLRFANTLVHAATGVAVCHGHTVHAVINGEGRPVRIPQWVLDLVR
jgi:acyl-CoA thioester hydrolase